MKTLYFDCFAGASGNMILGGLLSLGVNGDRLIKEIKKLNISDFEVKISEVNRAGINSVHLETIYKEEKKHRHFSDIKKIINESNLSESIKRRSIEIFKNLAEAEAKVHGIELEKVHFHEVGAMDAIIDVVGACIGFEILEIEKFHCSKIHTGSGFVEIEHGKYPVPPPAVAELLKGISTYSTEIVGELITPTGAAIIKTLCDEFGEIKNFQAEKIGYGAGTRVYENFPNVLRLMVGVQSSGFRVQGSGLEVQSPKSKDQSPFFNEQRTMNNEQLTLIETNLDDISGEILGFVMEKAFEIGALDCWFTPIQMKKNRPATLVSILCEPRDKEKFAELLYTETSTLGVRIKEIERECLPREIRKIKTEFGEIEIKIAKFKDKIINIKPEFEQIKKIANETGISLLEIEHQVKSKIKNI